MGEKGETLPEINECVFLPLSVLFFGLVCCFVCCFIFAGAIFILAGAIFKEDG